MPVSYSSYRPVDPVYTGFLATTAPVQSFVGRLATPRIAVENPAFIGKVFVDTHTTGMGTPQSLVVTPGAPLPSITTADPATVTYTCVPYGLKSNGIPKLSAARSQLPVDLVQRELRILRDSLAVAEEIRCATLYQTAGNFTTTAACTALGTGLKWNAAGAQPLADLRGYLDLVRQAAHGNDPNAIILPYSVAVAMGNSAELRGVYYGTAAGLASASMSMGVNDVVAALQNALGLKVFIGKGRKNTANFGQSHTEAEIWTDTVWVGCLAADAVADGASVRTLATATLAVDEMSIMGGLGDLGYLSAGVDEVSPSMGNVWVPYVQHSCAELVVSADLGATITDCL
jgi:hypothetical protein